MKKMYGMFGVEMRAYGQKLVKFCTHTQTDTRVNLSSIDVGYQMYDDVDDSYNLWYHQFILEMY